MDRSPGFACGWRLIAILKARFTALGSCLNLAANRNSLAHSTKGTPSQRMAAPTACRHTVSGTVSSRGAFHLSPHGTGSLSVIGECFSLEWWSPQIHTGFPRVRHYSGSLSPGPRSLGTGLSPCIARLPSRFPWTEGFGPDPAAQRRDGGSPLPHVRQRLEAYTRTGLGSCLFARATRAVSVDFLSSGYLDASSPAGLAQACIQLPLGLDPSRVPPFGDPRVEGCLPSPRLIAACHVLLSMSASTVCP